MGFANLGDDVKNVANQPMHHILEKLADAVERDGTLECTHMFAEFMRRLSDVALRMAQVEHYGDDSPYDGADVECVNEAIYTLIAFRDEM